MFLWNVQEYCLGAVKWCLNFNLQNYYLFVQKNLKVRYDNAGNARNNHFMVELEIDLLSSWRIWISRASGWDWFVSHGTSWVLCMTNFKCLASIGVHMLESMNAKSSSSSISLHLNLNDFIQITSPNSNRFQEFDKLLHAHCNLFNLSLTILMNLLPWWIFLGICST